MFNFVDICEHKKNPDYGAFLKCSKQFIVQSDLSSSELP